MLHISLKNSIPTSKIEHLLLELRTSKSLNTLSEYGFSQMQVSKITENFKAKWEKQKRTLTFSHISDQFEIITLLFPSKDLMDDRSECFWSLKKSTVYIPDGEEVSAFEALTLATYQFEKYLSKPKKLTHSIIVPKWVEKKLEAQIPLLESIIWARDLVNAPPQDSNPEKITEEVLRHKWRNFDVEIVDAKKLQKLGCNLILAVGAGSDVTPRMIILRSKKKIKGESYGLIGKWVTFDAGGLQIKPDTAMFDMKCDMSGAAGMLGVARYLDTFDTLPVNVIVAVGLVENLVGASAYKPLDIYKAYNGTTVEIHHTDAEWRLVLADVMSYVEDTYRVDHLITMATLTGACLYALGYDIAGIMGDDEQVISTLIDNRSPYEKVWRLPLNDKMKKALKAEIADLKNVTKTEKAGSSIGGAFLSYFQWKAKLTHLDIAGPAYRESSFGYMPKGATGWGVKVLSEFILGLKK